MPHTRFSSRRPGGQPSLSPDVFGQEVFSVGMDVIVHFACRDMNRAGMESRSLQLAMMSMKNILALTGEYTWKAFGGIHRSFKTVAAILDRMVEIW